MACNVQRKPRFLGTLCERVKRRVSFCEDNDVDEPLADHSVESLKPIEYCRHRSDLAAVGFRGKPSGSGGVRVSVTLVEKTARGEILDHRRVLPACVIRRDHRDRRTRAPHSSEFSRRRAGAAPAASAAPTTATATSSASAAAGTANAERRLLESLGRLLGLAGTRQLLQHHDPPATAIHL